MSIFSFTNTRERDGTLSSTGCDTLSSLKNARVYDAGDGKFPEHFLKSTKCNYESAIGLAMRESGLKVGRLLTAAYVLFACEITEALNVKWVPLWVLAPYSSMRTSSQISATSITASRGIRLSSVPRLSAMYVEDLPKKDLLEHDDLLMSATFYSIRHVLPRATALLLNSYEEANPEELVKDLKSNFKRLLRIGCLFNRCLHIELEPAEETGCLSWLNDQNPKTMARISIGSIANMSSEEIHATATALEETRTFSLRSLQGEFHAHFPTGFRGMTVGQGKMVLWAPQSLVLSHAACGLCVTHCWL